MPLNLPGLKDGLLDLAKNPPDTAPTCAAKWADAMRTYTVGIIPAQIPPAPEAGLQAFEQSLSAAFVVTTGALPLVETAFATLAFAIGTGMLGPAIQAFTPPPAPVGFAQLFVMPYPETAEDGANAVADIVDRWIRTGFAVNASGLTINWT